MWARRAFAGVARMLLFSGSAHADPATPPPISGQVWIVSDYRYRGLSLSNGHPALQASVMADGPNGLYGSLWASTIASYGGSHVEIDAIVGDRQTLGSATVDVSVVRYSYLDADHLSYWELPLTVSERRDAWTLSQGVAYAPAQRGTFGRGNMYGFAAVDWRPPTGKLGISGSLGYEDGAFADRKLDWNASARLMLHAFTLSASYVGFRAPAERGSSLVGTVGLQF